MPKSIRGVLREYKAGELHSGSSRGPIVTSRKQAVAIAISENKRSQHHRDLQHHMNSMSPKKRA